MQCICLLFSLLFCFQLVSAQDAILDNKIAHIDILIDNHQLDDAQKLADSLYQELFSKAKYTKSSQAMLELKYRQALILDMQQKPQIKPLTLLLEITDEAETKQLHALSCRIFLMIALCYEKAGNYALTEKYLHLADLKIRKYNLQQLYSTYSVRNSSYFRQVNQLDSMLFYALEAKKYAEVYTIEKDLIDSHLLIGFVMNKKGNYEASLANNLIVLSYRKKLNALENICVSYNNISNCYLELHQYSKALAYSDSAYAYYELLPSLYKYNLSKLRSQIFDTLGKTDSAYFYFKQYHSDFQLLQNEEDKIKTKNIEEQYQNNKNEAVIKNKNQQMIFSIIFLLIIGSAVILLFFQNRKITSKNKLISRHLADLSKVLEQKQVLMSELQHRVKNNLQHVISILEIQKESVDFNNIEELIRGNQNRIHSMALLHKKLKVTENVNDVDLRRYVMELVELVKESYDNYHQKISLRVSCEVETLTIDKAFPLGLIIVELVSNSMKHAFKNRSVGIITTEITSKGNRIELYYADNGVGFDFDQIPAHGLGQEIIKGLIDQLDGTARANKENGFELIVEFNI